MNDSRLIDELGKDESSKAWAYEQTQAQSQSIENEIKESQPLVSEKEPIAALAASYNEQTSADYLHKAKDLAKTYSHIRRVRGDGNCFYRALLFAEIELIMHDERERERFSTLVKGWRKRLFDLGFPEFTTDDFCDTFEEFIADIVSGKIDSARVLEVMNDDGLSNYYVTFLRLVTSGYLQENADLFQGFIDGNRTVVEFCKNEVDPMWKECDHVCITALIQGLGVPIRIEYMDRTQAPTGGWHHDFSVNDQSPKLFFLYRPGHYDVLYPQ
uniref:Ubiquitin thioesterase n=1 Tax=Plectus sambesii TaxID=2011161 RepID=A0A914VRS8_9BILA